MHVHVHVRACVCVFSKELGSERGSSTWKAFKPKVRPEPGDLHTAEDVHVIHRVQVAEGQLKRNVVGESIQRDVSALLRDLDFGLEVAR